MGVLFQVKPIFCPHQVPYPKSLGDGRALDPQQLAQTGPREAGALQGAKITPHFAEREFGAQTLH